VSSRRFQFSGDFGLRDSKNSWSLGACVDGDSVIIVARDRMAGARNAAEFVPRFRLIPQPEKCTSCIGWQGNPMIRSAIRQAVFCSIGAAFLCTAGCGGKGSTTPIQPDKTTPSVTVAPASGTITIAQSVPVTIAVNGSPAPTGSVTLSSGSYSSAAAALAAGSATITIPTGTLPAGTDTLTAVYTPDAAGSSTYNSSSGTGSITVTAVVSIITPDVTVFPQSSSIPLTQSFAGTVSVSGGSQNPTPTGTVTLSSGSYTSSAVALRLGSASITIPAGSLAVGTDTLTAGYTPDAASSSTYNSASGTGTVTVNTVGPSYVLTVDSAAPASGVYVQVSPADNNGASSGTAPFTRSYNAGTAVALSVATDSGSYAFVSWSGCASSSGTSCSVTMNGAATVTATYNKTQVLSIGVSPNMATIGSQQQFTATVSGNGSYSKAVTWAVTAPNSSLSPGGLSSTGLYDTPYPAPATVQVTATSIADPSISGSVTVTLSQPAAVAGPALTVDAGNQTHPINPFIYGMNAYTLSAAAAKAVNLSVDRWGGDATSLYNYQLDLTNAGSDWYFENGVSATGQEATGAFNAQVEADATVGSKTLGTVPVQGWVAKNGTSCSFPVSTYPSQYALDPYSGLCGDGELPDQTDITGNDPTVVAMQEGPSWAGNWVAYLVSQFGTAANGGVFAYDLDNEPAWWDAVHRDVHPAASTYDEVTNNGIATAQAIKTADSTAYVNGPVVDYWWNYFYSKKDIESGWASGINCYQPWSNPLDREAHHGIPFIEYYLQQFAAASNTYGARLLDYLDLHTYFAATYNGNGVGLTTAGDTGEQQARLNSTRVFWDPTYTDPNYSQPNYSTDPNYTPNCSNIPLQAPQLIPMARAWVAKDYPGTKIAFTEYNWGGQEHINGAVAQADILGIFGREGLDLGTLWGPPAPTTQVPGLMAFEIYRNYDGNNSMFGGTALASTSAASGTDAEGKLAVYGALRSSDQSITVMVINKTYGDLTSTLTLANFTTSSTTAQTYLYSNADLNAIVAEPNVTVTPAAAGGTSSTIATKFPAQSITLLVVPH
jgi:hypothetical protein